MGVSKTEETMNNLQVGARNLQRNSSFETNMDYWTKGEYWKIDSTTKHEEINSVKFTRTGVTDTNYNYISSGVNKIDCIEEQPYVASIYLMTKNKTTIDGTVELGIWFYDIDGNTVKIEREAVQFVENKKWIRANVKATAPLNTAYIALVVRTDKNGTFWICKPMLEKGTVVSDWSPHPSDIETVIDEKIVTAKAEIKITTDEISQSVERVEESTVKIKSDLDELDMNNRNLFRHSDFNQENVLDNWSHTVASVHTLSISNYNSKEADAHLQDVKVLRSAINIKQAINNGNTYTSFNLKEKIVVLEPNTTYTLSYLAYKGGGCKSHHTNVWTEDGVLIAKTEPLTTYTGIFQKQEVTFKTSEKTKHYIRFYHYFDETSTLENSIIYIYQPMLSRGNKATDWTVPYEDIEYEISTTKSQLASVVTNLDAITSTVSSTEKKVVKINEDISQMSERIGKAEEKITEDAITETVSKSFYTKDEIDSENINTRNYMLNTDFSRAEVLKGWNTSSTTTLSTPAYSDSNSVTADDFIKDQKVLRINTSIDECVKSSVTYGVARPLNITVEKNTVYTLNFWVYISGNVEKFRAIVYGVDEKDDSLTQLKNIESNTSGFQKLKLTFTTGNSNIISVRFYNYFKPTLTTGSSILYLFNPMLSKGSKSVGWQIAPEDLQLEIDANKFSIETTNETVAKHSTSLSGITSSISKLEEQTIQAKEDSLSNHNNLLINSNIKQGTEGWKLTNLELGTSLRQGTTTFTEAPDRNTIIIGDTSDNTARTRYMDSSKFIVQSGEKISMSFYIMSGSYVDTCHVYILFSDNTRPIEEDNSYIGSSSISVEGQNSWVKKTKTATVPEGATRAFIRIRYVSLKKTKEEDNNKVAITSLMVNRGDKYPTWTGNTEDSYYYHEKRLATAEQKITEDAITAVISKSFYSKEETEKQITSKDYATKSQVEQTVNALEIKFQESGGYNLLYNGDFRREMEKWTANDTTSVYIANGGLSSPDGRGARITGVSNNTKYIYQTISEQHFTSKEFTLSGVVYIGSSGIDSQDVGFYYYVRLDYDDGTYVNHHCSWDKTSYNKWHRVHTTFSRDTTKKITNIRVYFSIKSSTRYFYLSQAMLEVGSTCTAWTPNPNEISDGIVTIDKEGIDVSNSKSNTITTMSSDGFYISHSTQGDVFKVDKDGISLKQGIVDINKNGVKVTHSNGDYSQMNSSGFMRYVGGTGKSYHYLMSTGTVNVRDGRDVTVQLPDEFKGKSFQITISAFKVNIINGWAGIYDIDALVRSYDRPNGKFTIGGMVNDINGLEGTLDVSYIAIV